MSRQWRAPAFLHQEPDRSGPERILDLDTFLARASSRMFTVSAMAFQDAWTLDLERLRGCCIHVAAPGGRLIPFCAYNLTAMDGTGLYRGRMRQRLP